MRVYTLVLLLCGFALCPFVSPIASSSEITSTVITGATVVDGSGSKPFRADVRIEGDRITQVGRFPVRRGDMLIDARGMVLAPGFIDIHNHSETGLDLDPAATTQVSQGITTLVVGPDGESPWPIREYLSRREQKPSAVNVLSFVGHATIRRIAMGDATDRPADRREVDRMRELVEQGMREGAVGLSTGLEYDTGFRSTTEEIIELAKVTARHGGIYMSHIRDEADAVMSALSEAVRIGREARIPVQISHIKMGTVGVWGQARRAAALINSARRTGVDVTADCYPYEAWASTITVLVPSRRHDDPKMVEKGLADVGGGANILITECKSNPDYEGKTLEQIAREQKSTSVQVYINIVKEGGAAVVCRSMKEADIRVFYSQPWVMVASDGGIEGRHPRGAGSFPRVLGRYVRQYRWLTLEEAIRRMSYAPALRLGLSDRGIVRVGMKADLVIFNPARVIDRSTFKEPQLVSEGIERVFVNGKPVWEKGRVTGRTPGAVIRKAAAS